MADDSACVICGNEDSTPADLIILCDGCDIAVCQNCYFVTTVPDGDWHCRPCAAGARNRALGCDVLCAICERPGGALEPTMCSKWAHTACCQTFEEVFFVDLADGKAVANLSKLYPERRSYTCSLCENKGGTCIVCPRGNCRTAFHPMCARERVQHDGLVTYVEQLNNGQPVVRLCCAEHSRKLGGKLPPEVRVPKSTRVLPGHSIPAADSDADDDEATQSIAALDARRASAGPRVVQDPLRPRRKRGRLLTPGEAETDRSARYVEGGVLRPSDTVVLFDRRIFARFARATSHLRHGTVPTQG